MEHLGVELDDGDLVRRCHGEGLWSSIALKLTQLRRGKEETDVSLFLRKIPVMIASYIR